MHLRPRLVPLLLLISATLAASAAFAAAQDPTVRSATTMGPVGVHESLRSIMLRQAVLKAEGIVLKDQEAEFEQPDRRGLPQNPASLPLSQTFDKFLGLKSNSGGNGTLSPQTVGLSFTAATLSGTNPTSSFPPDCMGAVGPSQYVVFVNGRLVSFNKATGVADGVLNADPDVFFSSVINASSSSDPRIRYDRLTGRWFLVIINVLTPNRIMLAVSDASSAGVLTPSTTFTFFFINIASTPPTISSTCFADYPTLGIDANALYIGTNNFCGTGGTFNSCDGYVIRKTSILGAGPLVVTVFRGLVPTASGAGPYTPQGVDNYSPSSTEGYFIGVDNATFGTLMFRRVANPGGTPTVSANVSITVAATQFPINVPHLGNTGGTNGNLSSLDDRLFAAHLRNGRLWTAHNIGVNNTGAASGTLTRDGSRWYELNVPVGSGTPTVVQSGTVFTASGSNTTDQRSYWVPSVMVSGQGHVAMGMSAAGSLERANSATVGRLSGDGGGSMQTPLLFTSSTTAYNPPSDPGSAGTGRRWGDYTYTSLDPLDDMTMWTVQQFCDATNSYGVRIAKLVAPPPATPSAIADVTAGQGVVNVTLTGAVVAGSGFFDPGANLPGVPAFQHLSVSIINGAATGTPPTVTSATYVNPTTVQLVLNATSATASIAAERYAVTVTNPDGQSSGAAILRVVSAVPVVSFAGGPSLNEGNSGTTSFPFTVNITPTSATPVTVRYQTSNGTATVADGDYVAATDSVIIAPNQPSGSFNILVNGDTKHEPDESFGVTLTSATGANLGSPTFVTGGILNDDAVPTIAITPSASLLEGDAGSSPLDFAVTLSNPRSTAITAAWATSNGTATTADGDYVAGGGTVNIPAGQVAATISVSVTGDTRYEADETFAVTLSSPTAATLGNASSTGTILNDDSPPVVSIGSAAQLEGNAGSAPLVLTASLSAVSGLPVTVDYQTADSTATLANNDYQSASGTLTFLPGTTSRPVSFLVNGDLTLESDEFVVAKLANASGAAIGVPQGVGTIANDDNVPVVSVGTASVAEGNVGTTLLSFNVQLSNPTDQPVSVDYIAMDGTATVAGADYQPASGSVVIAAKTTSAAVDVTVRGDLCGEPDETLTLHIANPAGAALGDSIATGTILNDDDVVPPSATVTAPNGGEDLPVGTATSVQWSASDNVAVTAVDLLLSRDGGASYAEVLASGIANSGSFTWTPSGPPTTSAFVRVIAHDGACNTAADSSDGAFTISTTPTAVGASGTIASFALGAIRPNPSHGAVQIEYQLPREATVRLTVVDVQGREVALLAHGRLNAGRYTAAWSGSTARGEAPRGTYFARFEANGRSVSKRFVVLH